MGGRLVVFTDGVREEERKKNTKGKRFCYLLSWSPSIQDLLSLQQQFSLQCSNASVLH